MKIVIDISEEEYIRWQEIGEIDAIVVRNALVNGTPLPAWIIAGGKEVNKVLEKIRAEIKEQYGDCGLINDGLDMALSIIDKYMAEDEE